MIAYSEEMLSRCRSAIEPLIAQQWRETGDLGLACDPLWELYLALDRARCLVMVVARDDGRAVGYLIGSVYPHPNARQVRIGSLPTYFVEKRPGRGLILRSLLRRGIGIAFEKGAWRVTVATDHDHSAGRIIEAMGGRPTAVEFSFAKPHGGAKPLTEAIHA